MKNFLKIRDVLAQEDEYCGWLYLPDRPWTLDTEGVFAKRDKDADPDSDGHIPPVVTERNLSVTLDAAGIEDIIFNIKAQIDDPSIEQLFKAFVFYVDNDAFIDFQCH